MKKILELLHKEMSLVVERTSEKFNTSKAVIEKDLWVCLVLQYLFQKFKYKDVIVFKGGTSLSKVHKLIERFSEDIDLALDWRVLGYGDNEPYETRSNTKQLKFNEKLNEDTEAFLRDEFLPILKRDFQEITQGQEYCFYINANEGHIIHFDYPKKYSDSSILQVIKLEIGCLAEPIPSERQRVQTYIEEAYPEAFDEQIEVVAVDPLRTFYEKITILHREAQRVNGNYPKRYSRHFYDVYKMINTDLKAQSLEQLELLRMVIEFKKKFYACAWAKYYHILEGELQLVPHQEAVAIFAQDYQRMGNMLFGEKVSFDLIIATLEEYQKELNAIIKQRFLEVR